jgi:dTDP-4-amino-4,6-dideoxygalactose transaminase
MFYLLPPTGTPITLSDIYRIIVTRISRGTESGILEDQVKRSTGAEYCFLINSGRAALTILLESLHKEEKEKSEVIMPAYTCFTVAAAVARSGLKIRLADIDPLTLDYNYEKLQAQTFDKTQAIIGCNLFGVLNDWDRLRSIARRENVFLIDDAAQSMGAAYRGKVSGTLGDAGFYSLGRGKNLSTVSGGILITDDDKIASNMAGSLKGARKTGIIYDIKMLLNIGLYSLLLHPRLYWVPDKLPFLKLGQTFFDENFIIGELSDFQQCAGAVLFPKLGDINIIRSRNARIVCERILQDTGFSIPGYSADKFPIYLRLPVLARNSGERDNVIAALNRAGVKSSAMYPSTIRRIKGIEKYLSNMDDDFEGAQAVVERLFTLPTHHFVKDRDVDKIMDCLKAHGGRQ